MHVEVTEGSDVEVTQQVRPFELTECYRAWDRTERAKAILGFLRKAADLGISTNDIEYFFKNQAEQAKCVRKQTLKHRRVAKSCMEIKVDDAQVNLERQGDLRKEAREALRQATGGGKRFRNLINRLNKHAKKFREKLEMKNEKKLNHLQRKHNLEEVNREAVENRIKTKNKSKRKDEIRTRYPNLPIYKPEPEATGTLPEAAQEPLNPSGIKFDGDENEILVVNPKLPTQ